MQVARFLSLAALCLAGAAAVVTASDLLYRIGTATSPAALWGDLENWLRNAAYYAAIIFLAAATTVYITRKK